MRCSCLLLAFLLAVAEARGQNVNGTPPSSQIPAPSPGSDTAVGPAVFRSAVELVPLNVVVTDAHQKFVGGLSPADFAVFEDGVPQDVSFFAAGHIPLDLAILLDTSASMTDKMPIVKHAAKAFVHTLRAGDRVMVVDIKEVTRVLHQLSPDTRAANAAIDGAKASGGTGLYNGLYLALKELRKNRRPDEEQVRRQALVVLSDGIDTSSLMSFDDVMEVAKQSGVATYTITVRRVEIGTSGGRPLSHSEYSMKALAQETGARAFFPTDLAELDGVYGSIATELASLYAMAYSPKNVKRDGAYRKILVQVTDRPGVRTRTRAGYLSARPSRAGTLE